MADQNIKVKIDLDIAEFNKHAKELSNAISKVLGKDVDIFNAKLRITAQNAQQAGTAIGGAAKAVGDSGNAIKKSNQQWTNLALVVQDLPYGFRGIQNNLPALMGGFAAMTGPIYLVGSAIIALFTAWDAGLFKTKESTNALAKANKEYADSLKTSIGGASEEINKMQALTKIASNTAVAMGTRLQAVKMLQQEYPAYFGNLSQEAILNGNVKTAVDNVKIAIIERAKATAIAGKINQLSAEKFAKEEELYQLALQKTTKIQKALNYVNKMKDMGYTESSKHLKGLIDVQIAGIRQEENNIKKSVSVIDKELTRLGLLYEDSTTKSLGLTIEPAKNNKVKESIEKEEKDEKEKFFNLLQYTKDYYDVKSKYALDDLEKQKIILKEEQGVYDAMFALKIISDIEYAKRSAEIYKQLFDIKKKQDDDLYKSQVYFSNQRIKNIESRLALELKLNRNNIIGQKDAIKKAMAETGILAASALNPASLQNFLAFFDQLDYKLKATNDQWQSFAQNISNSISGFLADSLTALAENIGNALSGGEIKPLEHFQKLLADALINIGKMLIQYGTLMQIAFASPDPLVAIAAGVGAIALGTIIKNRLKQSAVSPTAFANGGIVSGPTMGLIGEYPGAQNNPEVVAPLDKLKDLLGGEGSGQFVLRGQDLVLAMHRSNTSLNIRRG
jgi:hypothetical protein